MKKIFIIIITLVSINIAQGQANLQFNQVKNLEFTGTTLPGTGSISYPITTIGSITVPQGKVLKIESVSGIVDSADGYIIFALSHVKVLIGNHLAFNSPGEKEAQYPIWLSAGNYPIKCIETGPKDVIVSISAIEFNVIP